MNSNYKILIIDDEADIVELLVDGFEFADFQVESASSGSDGIEILKQQSFDVVLSDYKMPNGDGKKVYEFIQSQDHNLIFVLLSGNVNLREIGIFEDKSVLFFSKPFNVDEIIEKVTNLLKSQK